MGMEKRTGGFTGHVSGFVRPRPGEEVPYICKDCGEFFMSRIPLLFDFGVKRCPKCGKFRAVRDERWLF